MFEDLIGQLKEWARFERDMPSAHMMERHIRLNIKQCVESKMPDIMIGELKKALALVDEFQYEPLKERLLNNFRNPRHYHMSSDLSNFQVVEPSIAGTWGDLIAGQRAAWGPNTASATQSQRLHVWTYGIYKPGREGMSLWDKFEYLPSYDEIIQTRLRAWGNKAPYWLLLNNGNSGGAPAYPTFVGTNFVEKARAKVRKALVQCTEAATSRMVHDVDYAVERVFTVRPGEKVRAYGHTINIIRQQWGYQLQIDGLFDKRIYPGEKILIEGRFIGYRLGE